jgi:hypothetical protein
MFGGSGDIAEDCVFERMNSSGAGFGAPDQVVRNCTFQDNGQLGFLAIRAHNLLFTGCTVRNNNTKGFNRQWEAGGDKIVLSRGVVLEKSRFVANHGSGIWFDIGNENCTVRNCLIADNEDAGLFYEISYTRTTTWMLATDSRQLPEHGALKPASSFPRRPAVSLRGTFSSETRRDSIFANKRE